jgi:predicted glycosyltransferase
MNREAVALGTAVYTIFSGTMGAVDERLIAEGRLHPLTDPYEIELVKREAAAGPASPRDPQLWVDAVLRVGS